MAKDVVFECPECHQWLEAPPDMAGLFVECPKCNAIVKIPFVSGASAGTVKKSTPPPVEQQNDVKGSTMRIDLPPNLGIPQAPKRRFVIRRKTP